MSSIRRLIVIAVIALLVGLIAKFPARVAYHWFAPPEIAVGGIHGTIWGGEARAASASGIYLSEIEWRMRPLALFLGKLQYTVTARPSYGTFNSDVSFGFGGDITFSELESNVSLQLIESMVGINGLRGTASAKFERLQISDGIAVAADGTLDVRGLVLPLVSRSSIGGYSAEFFTQDTGVVASVEDTDGIVDLAGSLSIGSDRAYEFLGQLAAKPETPEQVLQQMQFLGSANERGQYELRLEGQL